MLSAEAEILKELDSEYFPKFVDYKYDDVGNKGYLVMEYIDGDTLDQYLADSVGLANEEIQLHLATLIKAVEHLHSRGIVHRDLKPQNIMIGSDGNLKVIDFNISK
mmetsp:Transcript_6374/g.7325  ORF Transcript_6374/g.7325 Transcript_6374/m.7325 type:complete len:106 (-) Transcript_6374:395-712(-)|eukprot:CAMPEP_0168331526 /NCGR_PEP_ID=MMETSP0213-20121227/8386_1 /TAXON_ID=151035 /ORGANISM="Euplotes harpa, Strain FSP1.4" /LENGTH=105 /DNA_ID=CAMNT_0008335319 /DNA_START=345 /DNA_END=662 /DNA_ORIENTATION=-